jgi:hypothetical protein
MVHCESHVRALHCFARREACLLASSEYTFAIVFAPLFLSFKMIARVFWGEVDVWDASRARFTGIF